MPAPAPRPACGPAPILALMVLAGISFAIAQTIVAPALPAMEREYGAETATTSWVLTAFLLTASIGTPLAGKLGDLYGRSRVLAVVLLLFGVGATLAMLAETIGVLIAARALQGIGGGVFPLAIAILRETFPRERLPLAIGSMGATFGVGSGLGLPLSGVIVEQAGMPWIFGVGLLAVPVAGAVWWLVPSNPPTGERRVDWRGALVLGLGLAALLLGVSQGNAWGWTDASTLGLIVAGLVTLTAFVPLQRRTRAPMVDMRIMGSRPVLLANLATLLLGFSLLGTFVVIPQLAAVPTDPGYGAGLDVIGTGLVMAPSAVAMLVFGPIAGALYPRLGARRLAPFGLTVVALGLLGFATLHAEPWQLAIANGLFGVGIAFSLAALSNLVVDSVPVADVGVSTGINAIMRTIGGSIGASVLTALITLESVPGTSVPAESGFVAAFGAGAALALVAALLAAVARPADSGGGRRRAVDDDVALRGAAGAVTGAGGARAAAGIGPVAADVPRAPAP